MHDLGHIISVVYRSQSLGVSGLTTDTLVLAYTWYSIGSSDNPPPDLGISPSFSLEPPPSSPPRALSAPSRSAVLWPQRPRWCQVSIWTGWCVLEFSAAFPGRLSLPSLGLWWSVKPTEQFFDAFSGFCPSLMKWMALAVAWVCRLSLIPLLIASAIDLRT